MSTATHHADRSHRSYHAHRSAVGSLARTNWVREVSKEYVKNRFGLKSFLNRFRRTKQDTAGAGGGA